MAHLALSASRPDSVTVARVIAPDRRLTTPADYGPDGQVYDLVAASMIKSQGGNGNRCQLDAPRRFVGSTDPRHLSSRNARSLDQQA